MPKPHLKEFREDAVRVARHREPGVTIAQIAKTSGSPNDVSRGLGASAVLPGSAEHEQVEGVDDRATVSPRCFVKSGEADGEVVIADQLQGGVRLAT